MPTIGLLLNDPDNSYERALVEAAELAARRAAFELRQPHFALGSSVAQLAELFALQRAKVDGCLVAPMAPDAQSSAFEAVLRGGTDLVFLNRFPADIDGLRARYPERLVGSVAPDQTQIGRVQAEQCRAILPEGGFVLLVTGDEQSPSTAARRAGFLEKLGPHHVVHPIEGRWTAQGAATALTAWLKLGAARDRKIDAIVCQNDAMAAGVRTALSAQAAASGRRELLAVPITGVDGVESDGQRRVRDGSLTATVVMPLTTVPAIDMLAARWENKRPGMRLVLPGEPCPALTSLCA